MTAQIDQFKSSSAQQKEQFLAQLGVSKEQVALEAKRLQQEAALQNRTLDITQANNLVQNLPDYARQVTEFVNSNDNLKQLQEDYDITGKLEEQAAKSAVDAIEAHGADLANMGEAWRVPIVQIPGDTIDGHQRLGA